MLGKIEGSRRRGQQTTRWLDGITSSMDTSLSKIREMVKDRKAWHVAVHGVTELDTAEQLSNKSHQRSTKSQSLHVRHICICIDILDVRHICISVFIVVVQLLSHVRLCDTMDCSVLGFPVLHYLPEFAQVHIYLCVCVCVCIIVYNIIYNIYSCMCVYI